MTPMHVRSFCINYVRRLVRPTCARTYASKRVEEVTTPKLKPAKLNAYSLFVKDKFTSVEGIGFGEKTKALALTWSNMSKEEKQVFVERAGKENESRPPRTRQKSPKRAAHLNAEQQRTTLPQKPKRHLTPYNLFIKENLTTAPGTTIREKMKAAGAQWKMIDKAPYVAQAKTLNPAKEG
mmetsp:Transcript_45585/g.81531  ORF Transcript_45585/g.81531 Transcript_45585/m.81531 type:complete len:180 (-) Transcript_45585:632-1171(-)